MDRQHFDLKDLVLWTKSVIQYGNQKFGTCAYVFFQTLVHGNSKNEIKHKKQRKKVWREKWIYWNKYSMHKKSPNGLTNSGQPCPRGGYSLNQSINYLTNQIYIYLTWEAQWPTKTTIWPFFKKNIKNIVINKFQEANNI